MFDPELVPMDGRECAATVIRDGGAPESATVRDRRLRTEISGRGITAIVLHDVGPIDIPLHRAAAPPAGGYHFEDDGLVGSVRGILIPKPDGTRYHAYVQAATREPATLHYSVDGGTTVHRLHRDVRPNEWTVPVDDIAAAFTYFVQVGDQRSRRVTLACEGGA